MMQLIETLIQKSKIFMRSSGRNVIYKEVLAQTKFNKVNVTVLPIV